MRKETARVGDDSNYPTLSREVAALSRNHVDKYGFSCPGAEGSAVSLLIEE